MVRTVPVLKSGFHETHFLWVRQLVEGANSVDTSSSAEASSVQATLKSATMVLTSAPIICVYPFVQRYFVQGMTMGAVKG